MNTMLKTVGKIIKFTSAALIGALLAGNLTSYFLILNPKPVYAAASYSVNLDVDKAQASRGEQVTYTLIITNNGDVDLNTVTAFQSQATPYVTYVNGSSLATKNNVNVAVSDSWYSSNGGTSLGKLTPGQNVKLVWKVTVNNDAPQTQRLEGVVGIRTTELPQSQGYNIGFTVAINASRSSLCGSKAVDKTTARVGDTVTYTIKVCNDGDTDQTNVIIWDRVPKEVTYVPGSTRLTLRGGTITVADRWIGNAATNTDGDGLKIEVMNSGNEAVVTFQATVNSQARDGVAVENVAQFKSDQLPTIQKCAVTFVPVVPPIIVCTGSIGDYVWNDTNGNGIQDSGEAGISGVTVTLKSAGGTVIATTTTDNSGIYHFNNLCAATYVVEVSGPSGYTATTTNASGSTTSSDSNPSPSTVVLTANNSVDNTIDFGFKQNAITGNANCSLTKKIKLPNGSEQGSVGASDHTYASGEQIIYRLFISNPGNADANPVSISDSLPPYLYWVSGDGGYAAGDNKVNFDLGTLKAGESKTLTYNVKVRDNIPSGQVNQTNSAKVTSPASFNNCTSTSTLVIGKPGAVLAAAALPQTGSVPPSVLATLGLVVTGLAVRLKKAKLYKYR